MTPRTRNILAALGGALLFGVMGSESHWFAGLWKGAPQTTLTISGNIEAHESVLSFRQVQSRIVELPFDEGQWVHQGDLIAQLDDAGRAARIGLRRMRGAASAADRVPRRTDLRRRSDIAAAFLEHHPSDVG
jgi:HlyD family secretion protein